MGGPVVLFFVTLGLLWESPQTMASFPCRAALQTPATLGQLPRNLDCKHCTSTFQSASGMSNIERCQHLIITSKEPTCGVANCLQLCRI